MTSQNEAASPADVLEYITRSIADEPEDVRVKTISGSEEVVIELRVANKDVGKMIGKGGSVVRALRSLLTAMGGRAGAIYTLEIID